MNVLRRLILIVVLLLPVLLQFAGPGNRNGLVCAEDDVIDDTDLDDDTDATVENDDVLGDDVLGTVTDDVTETDADTRVDEDEEEEEPLKPSPDADTHILFIHPVTSDLPAGQPVKILVGFSNKGSQDFSVDSMDAAFRYPQDYSYYIQNFTAYRFDRTVEPDREATFEYRFVPSESFSSRSFGLTVNLNYHDSDGVIYQDAVFNTTVNVIEPDEGLDGETFFLYLFLVAIIVLLIVGVQQLLTSFGKKHLQLKPKTSLQPTVEMGTQNNRLNVDFDWLPKETLQELHKPAANRSPKGGKTSPRQRNTKRRSGTVDD